MFDRKLSGVCAEFENILTRNGWLRVSDKYCMKGTICYEMVFQALHGRVTVRASYVERSEDEDPSYFGILNLFAYIPGHRSPLYAHPIANDMLIAVEHAEDNLLTIGIPFLTGYTFHGQANNMSKNNALRKKYSLDILNTESSDD